MRNGKNISTRPSPWLDSHKVWFSALYRTRLPLGWKTKRVPPTAPARYAAHVPAYELPSALCHIASPYAFRKSLPRWLRMNWCLRNSWPWLMTLHGISVCRVAASCPMHMAVQTPKECAGSLQGVNALHTRVAGWTLPRRRKPTPYALPQSMRSSPRDVRKTRMGGARSARRRAASMFPRLHMSQRVTCTTNLLFQQVRTLSFLKTHDGITVKPTVPANVTRRGDTDGGLVVRGEGLVEISSREITTDGSSQSSLRRGRGGLLP